MGEAGERERERGRQASYNCQFNSGPAGGFYRNLTLLEEEGEWRPEVPDSGIPSAPVSVLNQTPGEKKVHTNSKGSSQVGV